MALEKLQNADFVRRAQANFDTIGEHGKYTCVADDDTANLVDIATGKADATAVHGNYCVTGNAKGTAGAGAIVAGAKMMLQNYISASDVANAIVPANGTL